MSPPDECPKYKGGFPEKTFSDLTVWVFSILKVLNPAMVFVPLNDL